MTVEDLQSKIFTRYIRTILPADGFVFWVRADLLSTSALYNALSYNTTPYNTLPLTVAAAKTLEVKGSFHRAAILNQEEDETYTSSPIAFEAQGLVREFQDINPNELYIGQFNGVKYAFSSHDMFFENAGIYHYKGHAVNSVMATQIVDDPHNLNLASQVVSNSLPIWLSMVGYENAVYEDFAGPSFPMYPSFLTPQNQTPPYAAVHIEPTETVALASTPYLDDTLSHYQLCKDTVSIAFFGVRNDDALTFMDFVNQFSVNTDAIGLMNMPVIQDDKRPQVEFLTLAQKKTATFEVSYYQKTSRDLARQLITQAIPTFYVEETPIPLNP